MVVNISVHKTYQNYFNEAGLSVLIKFLLKTSKVFNIRSVLSPLISRVLSSVFINVK